MSAEEVFYRMAPIEVRHLAGLVDELSRMIADADERTDPAIDRLTPSPYPDDHSATAEFAAATRDDLLDRRTADAAVVGRVLAPFIDGDDANADVTAPPEQVDVIIRRAEIDPWLRTLTVLRLVIANRLGITAQDDDHDPDDPRFGVYDWLGYRLDGLVAIADRLDGISDDA